MGIEEKYLNTIKTMYKADDMISYTDNPKDPTKKLLELVNESLMVQETKSTNRNQFHFYTPAAKDLRKKGNNPLTIASETVKY